MESVELDRQVSSWVHEVGYNTYELAMAYNMALLRFGALAEAFNDKLVGESASLKVVLTQ